jgi:methyl-accepting chemotaxis protein
MKIQNKILISLAIPAVFVVMFVTFVYLHLSQVNQQVNVEKRLSDYKITLVDLQGRVQGLVDEVLRISVHSDINRINTNAINTKFTDLQARKDTILNSEFIGDNRQALEEAFETFAAIQPLVVDQLLPAINYGANRAILVNVNDLIDLGLSDGLGLINQMVLDAQVRSDQNILRIDQDFQSMRTRVVLHGIIIILMFVATIMMVRFSVIKKLREFISTVENFTSGDGDLTKRIPVNSKDEFGELAVLFNEFTHSIQDVVREVWVSAATIINENILLNQAMEDFKSVLAEQADSINKIAGDISDIAQSSSIVSQDIEESAGMVDKIVSDIEDGGNKLSETKKDMEKIREHTQKLADTIKMLTVESGQIGEMLTSINGIADQTNLLALNAAIEAARAGDAGRGFAVVADEVRKLAEGTQDTVKEIEKVVKNLSSITKTAAADMEAEAASVDVGESVIMETEAAFKLVTSGISDMGRLSKTVYEVVNSQSTELTHLNKDMMGITVKLEKGQNAINDLEEAVDSLTERAEALKKLVGKFKT